MKVSKIIIILTILFSKALHSQPLHQDEIIYKFKIISNNCLNVNAKFLGDPTGKTVVVAPWDTFSHLSNQNIYYNIAGSAQQLNSDHREIQFSHNPNAEFTANYDLCYDPLLDSARFPFVENNFFSFYSQNVLLYPKISSKKKLNITFDFSSLPENNNVFSSFGKGKVIKVNKNISEMLFSQFVGGDLKPTLLKTKEAPTYLIEYGKWSFFNENKSYDLIDRLIQYQRNEMQDHDFPSYVITLIKQSDEVPFKTISGVHAKNSIFITFPDGSPEKFYKILYIMSHELFHNWLGSKIEIPMEIRTEYRWFFEGFTDYFALTMAKDGGFINAEQYAKILNYYIQDYFSSPLNTLPNKLYISSDNASDTSFNFIQTRGHLLAILFSNLLKEKGRSENDMKLFIKDLISEASKNDSMLTNEIFWTSFSRYFDQDFKLLIEKHIVNGEKILLPVIKGFHLTQKEIDIIDPGFDLIQSIHKGKVLKLNKKSPAFNSGLVENADFKSHRFTHNQQNPEMIVAFNQGSQKKEIVFQPKLIKTKIYQYAT